MTKGLRKAIRALYENQGVDSNAYIEDGEEEEGEEEKEENRSFNGDLGQQEGDDGLSHEDGQEPPRQQPFEYESEASILPPESPRARLMPIPRSLQHILKTPS